VGSSRLVHVPRDRPAGLALPATRPFVIVLCVGQGCEERAPGHCLAPRVACVVKGASASVSRARRLPWWGGPGLARPTDLFSLTAEAPLAPVF
jgi:hypothetical protein